MLKCEGASEKVVIGVLKKEKEECYKRRKRSLIACDREESRKVYKT